MTRIERGHSLGAPDQNGVRVLGAREPNSLGHLIRSWRSVGDSDCA